MFKCQACGSNSLPHEKQFKFITRIRHVDYINLNNKLVQGFEPVTELIVGKCCVEECQTQLDSGLQGQEVKVKTVYTY
jgi:hypothetical protein